MKVAGFLLLPAGWVIVFAAVVLLNPVPLKASFIIAGVAVEALGFGLTINGHLADGRERR